MHTPPRRPWLVRCFPLAAAGSTYSILRRRSRPTVPGKSSLGADSLRVAVVTSRALFVRGGAELLAEAVTRELRERGHDAKLFECPFTLRTADALLDSMAAARLMRLDRFDRLIAFKFPAYLVPHDDKVLWVVHQLRQAYDLWGTAFGFPSTREGVAIRRAVVHADNACLPAVRRLYTNSATTRGRLLRFNGVAGAVLHPPVAERAMFESGEYGDYLFFPSRMNDLKRQWLAVEALARTRTDVCLVLAGPPQNQQALERVTMLVRAYGLERRVRIMPEWISTEAKVALLAGALGCIYPPVDEDSYGFVSLEAFSARRPVITATDSGGTHELVVHDQTGEVVSPEPEAMAAAMDRLFLDRERARRLGEAGWELVQRLEISWDRVVERLTS